MFDYKHLLDVLVEQCRPATDLSPFEDAFVVLSALEQWHSDW